MICSYFSKCRISEQLEIRYHVSVQFFVVFWEGLCKVRKRTADADGGCGRRTADGKK